MHRDDTEWRYRERKRNDDEVYLADKAIEKATWPLWRHLVIWTVLLIMLVGGGTLLWKKTFGVAIADADREIFEESKSYVHGTIRDIENLRIDYVKAKSDSERAVIAQVVLHRVSTFGEDLPTNLTVWVDSLKQEELK